MAKKKIRLIARLDVKDTNLVKGIQEVPNETSPFCLGH